MLKIDVVQNVMSVDAIENGSWMHVRSPIIPEGAREGPLMYLNPEKQDGPVRVKVRSHRSRYFQNKELQQNTLATSRVNRAKDARKDDMLVDAVAAERPRRFSALVTALENFSRETPGIQTPDEKELFDLARAPEDAAGNIQWLVDQVMDHAFEDNNYGGEAVILEAKKSAKNAVGATAPETSNA